MTVIREGYLMSKKVTDSSNFDSILLEAIDEALSVYGEATKSAFYAYLKKAFGIPKFDIPTRIDEFSMALQSLFGLGSKNLEILFMKNLHSRIGVVWEWRAPNPWVLPDLTFKEYVSFAKRYFEDAKKYEDKMSIIVKEKEAMKMYR